MDTARRLYVYSAALTGLVLLSMGTAWLLGVAILEALELLGGRRAVLSVSARSDSDISLALAFVAIGLPVWAAHWWFAQGSQRVDGERGQAERASGIRAGYMALVTVAAFLVSVATCGALVDGLFDLLTGVGVATRSQSADTLATALVSITLWLAHSRMRGRDLRRSTLAGAAAWLPRLARHSILGVALGIGLAGASAGLTIPADVLLEGGVLHRSSGWLAEALSAPLALLIVGLGAWAIAWRESDGVIRDRDVVGEDERATRTRAFYFGGVILGVAAATAACLALLAMAIPDVILEGEPVDRAVEPLLIMLPPLLAGWLHQRRASEEGRALGQRAEQDAERRSRLLVAIVGVALLGTGAATLGTLLLETPTGTLLFEGGEAVPSWQPIAGAIAMVLAGATLWLPAWWRTLKRRAADPLREAGAASMAGYLFAVAIVALVAATACAAIVLYRVFDSLLGAGPDIDVLGIEARTVSTLVVALVAAGYHGWLIRADRGLVRHADVVAAEAAEALAQRAPEGGPEGAAATDGVVVPLVLRVRAGTDVERVVMALRAVLPAGSVLRAIDPGTVEDPTSARAIGVSQRPMHSGGAWIP